MMSRLIACIVAIATILSIGPGFAHEFKKGSITVEHPWSRATPGGAQVATGYLTIENDGAEPDRLVSATAEIAGHTGIHQMSMVDGMVKMRELTEGLPVPSLAAALFALLGWLALEASDMSDAANAADVLAAIPTVLLGTSFGHDLFAQALRCSPRSCFSRRGRSDGSLRPWGWRGSLLPFRPGIAMPSPWNMARACCSMRKDCTSLPAVPGSADCCRC